MIPNQSLFLLFLIISFLVGAQALEAEQASIHDLELRLQAMRSITQYDPLEGGGSYGDAAGNMGIGMQSFQAIDPAALSQRSETVSSTPTRQQFPKLTLLRGLLYPLDFGLQYGTFMQGPGMLGTHLQYTWFDEFRWPSIAVRAHYSQLTGVPQQNMRQTGLSVFASYGPFYWLQAYLGYGIDQENYKIRKTEDDIKTGFSNAIEYKGFDKSLLLYYGLRTKLGSSPYSMSLGENRILSHSSDSAKAGRALQFKAAYGF